MPPATANRRKLKAVLGHLQRAYGPRRWKTSGRAVDVLIGTILSQNTNAANSSAGLARLKARFPTWQAVAEAPTRRIADCIRVSGLSRIKAPRIRSILRRIRAERGRISLEFLRRRQPREAFEYLTAFDGVGPKTALCVLLFSFGMTVFPVDTHIRRIAARLGVIGENASLEKAHDLLGGLIEPEDRYAMHVLLIAHGRSTCLARGAKCGRCCIRRLCRHGRSLPAGPARDSAANSTARTKTKTTRRRS